MVDRLVVRTQRLTGLIRAGALLVVVGFLAVLIGAGSMWFSSIGQAAFANDRAALPGTLTFDGNGGDYSLQIIENPLRVPDPVDAVTQIVCEVSRPDGSSETVDGSATPFRTETDIGVEIGRFSTTAGETIVDCQWIKDRDRKGYYATVAPVASWFSIASKALLVGGIVLLLVSAALLYRGFRGRSVTERVPGAAPSTEPGAAPSAEISTETNTETNTQPGT